jgi:hypothetical protein
MWCLEHSVPSSEDVHGTYRITEVIVTKVNGQMTERYDIVEKPKCALAGVQEGEDPCCNVIQSGQCSSLHKIHSIEFIRAYNVRLDELG